jgi:hypothetical protein
MPETQFQAPFISSNTGKLRIDVEHINGQGGPIYPQLFVPLHISLTSGEVYPTMGMGMTLPKPDDPIEQFANNFISFSVMVPQSHWVEKVLPGLGMERLPWWRCQQLRTPLETLL